LLSIARSKERGRDFDGAFDAYEKVLADTQSRLSAEKIFGRNCHVSPKNRDTWQKAPCIFFAFAA